MSKKTSKASDSFDWSRFDALTGEEVHAAALADPDAQPWTEEQLSQAKRTPRVKIVRRALGLTQEEFSGQFGIPLGTLRDWEQGRKVPDQAARSFLTVIASDPGAVRNALELHRQPQPPQNAPACEASNAPVETHSAHLTQEAREYLTDMLKELSAVATWAEFHRLQQYIDEALQVAQTEAAAPARSGRSQHHAGAGRQAGEDKAGGTVPGTDAGRKSA